MSCTGIVVDASEVIARAKRERAKEGKAREEIVVESEGDGGRWSE